MIRMRPGWSTNIPSTLAQRKSRDHSKTFDSSQMAGFRNWPELRSGRFLSGLNLNQLYLT